MPLCDGVEVAASGLHGMGLFATKRIPKGEAIWRFKNEGTALAGEPPNQAFTATEMRAIAGKCPAIFKGIVDAGYLHATALKYVMLNDGAQYCNHSSNPNAGSKSGDEPDGDHCVALRNIQPGEEITKDYSYFKYSRAPWLAELCAEHPCDRSIFEDTLPDTDGSKSISSFWGWMINPKLCGGC